MNHHELPQGIRLQRPVWWRPGEGIDRPLTHEELAHIKTPCAAPAAGPVEDEPCVSASKRRKVHVDSIARDWFLEMLDQWKTERRWDMRRCLREVQRLCPGVFDGIDPNTPYRWKRSAPRGETLGRRTLLSPADTTRLSEHTMRVTDVLCLSAVTIRGLVHEWRDAEGLDVRAGATGVKQLLRGMRLSHKKPAKCLKELHSTALQEANTHRLFIKLCWLMDKHTESVVIIDETSCRLVRWLSCRATQRRPRRSRWPSAWAVDRWTCSCRSYTLARQTPSCRSSPQPHWTACSIHVEVLYTTPHIYEQMTAQIMATSLTCLSTTR